MPLRWSTTTSTQRRHQRRKIRLVIEDDKCTGNDLVAVVKKLITVDHVFILHGGSCTAAIAAALDYVQP